MTALHPGQEAILREWVARAAPGQAAALSVSLVRDLLAEVDAARAGRPVVGAPVPRHQLDKEAAQMAPDGEE